MGIAKALEIFDTEEKIFKLAPKIDSAYFDPNGSPLADTLKFSDTLLGSLESDLTVDSNIGQRVGLDQEELEALFLLHLLVFIQAKEGSNKQAVETKAAGLKKGNI